MELKEEYEKLKQEMEKAEHEITTNYQKKKGVAAQKKEAKIEKEEAEKYKKTRQELVIFSQFMNTKALFEIKRKQDRRIVQKGVEFYSS